MNLDIMYSINESTESVAVVKKHIGYVSQTAKSIASILENYNDKNINKNIYVTHSKPLKESSVSKLQSLGAKIIFDEEQIGPYNRQNVYKHNMGGDYTLVLDSDTIFLKNPTLFFEKDVYVSPSGSSMISESAWKKAYDMMGLKYRTQTENYFNLYIEGKDIYSHGINNGCILIKNDIKKDVYDMMKDSQVEFEKSIKIKNFAGQIFISLLMKKFNWGYLDNKINYYPIPNFKSINIDDIEILHYRGTRYLNSFPEIIKILDRYDP